MTSAGTIYPHTAVTTWNGFIYQGKVAIFHVLQLLNAPGIQTNFVLQLDSLEDFAILDNAGAVISLHQIKALKSQYYSSYTDAFEKLKNKAAQSGCTNAKFHIARAIADKTEIEIALLHDPIKIYEYGTDFCCPVDEIDSRIEGKIKTLLATFHPGDHSKQSDDYVRMARGYLDQIVLKKVMSIHRIVHDNLMSDGEAAYTQTIPSIEFLEVLRSDLNQANLGDDYYFYILLNDINEYYQGYCLDNEDDLDSDALKKLSSCIKVIGCLQKAEMVKFIQNIMPHRMFKFRSLREYKDNSFNKEEIQEAFLTILNALKSPEFDHKYFFKWIVAGKTFSPTTIDKGQTHAKKICQYIINNAKDTDLEVMFDGNCLITTNIDVPSVLSHLPEVTRTPESDKLEENRITRWKTISMISLENARGVIQ